MTDARTWLHARAAQHLPSTARKYKFRQWTGLATYNQFGGIRYLSPSEGTIVDQDDEYTLIKEKGSNFTVFSTALATVKSTVGDKVVANFYELRDFQGLKSDGSDDPAEVTESGAVIRSFALTGAKTHLPFTWKDRYASRKDSVKRTWANVQNPYLIDLIKQIEDLKVDSCRTVADLLVCAKARNLSVFDPAEAKSCDEDRMKWPSIAMAVTTSKFTGNVAIRYDRAGDVYEVDFCAPDGTLEIHENIYFDGIGDLLMRTVEDGSWKMVNITIIKKAAKKREVA